MGKGHGPGLPSGLGVLSSTPGPFPTVPHLHPWGSPSSDSGCGCLPSRALSASHFWFKPGPLLVLLTCRFSLYRCPCRSRRDSRAGQLAVLEGAGSPLESCLSLCPWQEVWQLQHCDCPGLSEKAPGVHPEAATGLGRPQTLMTSAQSRVRSPRPPNSAHVCPSPLPPGAMPAPGAASGLETSQ